jgi:hypothetical protein
MDKDVIGLALAENRILLTEDKDFGWLVFAGRIDSPGVVLMRFPASARSLLAESILKLVSRHASQLGGGLCNFRAGVCQNQLRTSRPRVNASQNVTPAAPSHKSNRGSLH